MQNPVNNFSNGNLTASATTGNQNNDTGNIVLPLRANSSSAAFSVSGTFSATLQFEATVDGIMWSSLAVTPSSGGIGVTSTTTTGTWAAQVTGYTTIRIRCSQFTSGTIFASIVGSLAAVSVLSNGTVIVPGQFNVQNYGAVGNCKTVNDAATVSSGNHVTSATANFGQADVGKAIYAVKSGQAQFSASSTIQTVNSATDVTIAGTVAHANTGCTIVWGHDDTAAIAAALAAAIAQTTGDKAGNQLYFPAGGYWNSLIWNVTSNTDIVGAGMLETIIYLPPDFGWTPNTFTGLFINTSNNQPQLISGLTFDGSTATLGLANSYAIAPGNTIIQNVQMQNFEMGAGANNVLIHGGITSIDNLICTNCTATCVDCTSNGTEVFISNSSLVSTDRGLAFGQAPLLRVVNTAMTGGQYGVYADGTASADMTFTNCKFTGTTKAAYISVTGMVARFTNCWIEGAIGIDIVSGASVYASNSVIKTDSTNAITNAGTFYDLGGNSVTGTLAGAGTYQGPTFAVPAATRFVSSFAGSMGGQAVTGANDIDCIWFMLPYPITFSFITAFVVTQDASNPSDWGIYSVGGTLLANVGPQTATGTGIKTFATTQGAVTLQPGEYCFAYTSAGSTFSLEVATSGSASFFPLNAIKNGTSSLGTLPGTTTITFKTNPFWAAGSTFGYPWFALHA